MKAESITAAEQGASICARAVATWGRDNQLRQLQEECGELVAAVNQHARGRVDDAALASEVADVIIMVTQATIMLGPLVDMHVALKLRRLEERISAAEAVGVRP